LIERKRGHKLLWVILIPSEGNTLHVLHSTKKKILKFPEKKKTLQGIPEFSNSFSFPFGFPPGISRIFGGMVRSLEIQQLLDFLET